VACSQHCVLPVPTAVTHRHLVITVYESLFTWTKGREFDFYCIFADVLYGWPLITLAAAWCLVWTHSLSAFCCSLALPLFSTVTHQANITHWVESITRNKHSSTVCDRRSCWLIIKTRLTSDDLSTAVMHYQQPFCCSSIHTDKLDLHVFTTASNWMTANNQNQPHAVTLSSDL